jgi:hypothetical protein
MGTKTTTYTTCDGQGCTKESADPGMDQWIGIGVELRRVVACSKPCAMSAVAIAIDQEVAERAARTRKNPNPPAEKSPTGK